MHFILSIRSIKLLSFHCIEIVEKNCEFHKTVLIYSAFSVSYQIKKFSIILGGQSFWLKDFIYRFRIWWNFLIFHSWKSGMCFFLGSYECLINLYSLTLSWQGRLLARQGDYTAAAQIYKKILELRYACADLHYYENNVKLLHQ